MLEQIYQMIDKLTPDEFSELMRELHRRSSQITAGGKKDILNDKFIELQADFRHREEPASGPAMLARDAIILLCDHLMENYYEIRPGRFQRYWSVPHGGLSEYRKLAGTFVALCAEESIKTDAIRDPDDKGKKLRKKDILEAFFPRIDALYHDRKALASIQPEKDTYKALCTICDCIVGNYRVNCYRNGLGVGYPIGTVLESDDGRYRQVFGRLLSLCENYLATR